MDMVDAAPLAVDETGRLPFAPCSPHDCISKCFLSRCILGSTLRGTAYGNCSKKAPVYVLQPTTL